MSCFIQEAGHYTSHACYSLMLLVNPLSVLQHQESRWLILCYYSDCEVFGYVSYSVYKRLPEKKELLVKENLQKLNSIGLLCSFQAFEFISAGETFATSEILKEHD